MVFLAKLSAVSLFSRKTLCVFVSVMPFNHVKTAIDLNLNVSFRGGLKMYN